MSSAQAFLILILDFGHQFEAADVTGRKCVAPHCDHHGLIMSIPSWGCLKKYNSKTPWVAIGIWYFPMVHLAFLNGATLNEHLMSAL